MTLVLIPLDTTPDLPFKDFINICSIDKSVRIPDHFSLVCLTVWLHCIKGFKKHVRTVITLRCEIVLKGVRLQILEKYYPLGHLIKLMI